MSEERPDSPPTGGDIHADALANQNGDGPATTDHPDRVVQTDDERHEEALEESFPASDPPSAKHIT